MSRPRRDAAVRPAQKARRSDCNQPRPRNWGAQAPRFLGQFFIFQKSTNSVKLVNTTLKQKTLYAAKYSSLKRFTRYLHKQTKTDKRPLLLFVTDHGTRNRKDTSGRNQYISLWQEERPKCRIVCANCHKFETKLRTRADKEKELTYAPKKRRIMPSSTSGQPN